MMMKKLARLVSIFIFLLQVLQEIVKNYKYLSLIRNENYQTLKNLNSLRRLIKYIYILLKFYHDHYQLTIK